MYVCATHSSTARQQDQASWQLHTCTVEHHQYIEHEIYWISMECSWQGGWCLAIDTAKRNFTDLKNLWITKQLPWQDVARFPSFSCSRMEERVGWSTFFLVIRFFLMWLLLTLQMLFAGPSLGFSAVYCLQCTVCSFAGCSKLVRFVVNCWLRSCSWNAKAALSKKFDSECKEACAT